MSVTDAPTPRRPRDARGYSWPPFVEGNRIAERHGAKSKRHVQPLADAMAEIIRAESPLLASPRFTPELAAWAYAEAQAALLRDALDEIDVVAWPVDDGRPHGIVDLLDKVEKRAAASRERLGLNPQAMAKLLNALASASSSGNEDATDALKALRIEGQALAALAAQTLGAKPLPPGGSGAG